MLEARDLAVARGGIAVLEGVSFSVKAGEALILRGPNGSGKTTLLRVLAGLQPPLSGEVIGAEDLAYAGHADGIKSALTVTENLSFWAGVYGTGSIEPALEGFNIASLRSRSAGSLSAGQKRRLGLARLLVTGRKVWALDEPTVSLDTASVALFARALETHLGQGGAAIVATHIDLGFAAQDFDVGACKAKARPLPEAEESFL